MVRDNYGGGTSRPLKPFRSFGTKLYEMVNDPSSDSVISWSENGNSFIVWNQSDRVWQCCSSEIITRQCFVDFHQAAWYLLKVDESEQFEYANDHFVRGKPELLPEIQKRYIASLPPDPFYFKRKAETARVMGRARALKLALDERNVTKSLSSLTL